MGCDCSFGEIELGERSVLTVPQSVIVLRDGRTYAFILGPMAKPFAGRPAPVAAGMGGIDREVHVDLDPSLMAGLGISAAITIPLADGRHVRLDQIARVSDTHADRSTLAFIDGKPAIAFQVTRTKGFSDMDVAKAAREAVAAFAVLHPEVSIIEVSTTVTPVVDNYEGSLHLLLEGALLAVLVLLFHDFLQPGAILAA